ncbi:uncharacterized protein LOC117432754 [Acipenser ruthenus]|uniref:uncharacterized protein LOC117432754 n=1 Tax=Acipenser ruthenus TaxID=7906 RepID=UPI002740B13B|nr:uncharacterized protein LOC117432754 [Acipenser ruthenus]
MAAAGFEPGAGRGIMAAEQESEETVSQELQSASELRIVLLGGWWAGKSASGNTILGREEFRSGFSLSRRTKECEKGTGEVSGRRVTVVDTPGLLDTDRVEIERCVSLSAPGPHAFLLLIPVFTKETIDTNRESVVEWYCKSFDQVQELFGERAVRNMMILFTRGDDLTDRTIEQHIEEAGEELQQLVEKCGNRYHVLNNNNRSDRTQVTQLLDKIDNMVKGSGGCYIPNEIYQEVEERIRLKEQELNEKHKEELSRREEERKLKYEEEQRRREEEMKQKYEEEQRRREEEMKQKYEEEQRRREEMKQKYEEEQRRREEMKQKYEEEQRRREEMKQKYEEEQRRREEEMKQKYEEEQRRREEELMEKLRKQMKEEELEKEAEESKLPVRRRNSKEFLPPIMSGGEGEAPLADTQAPPSPPELRMVLLGKTGAGKSAAGNTILGREEFRSVISGSSVTRVCEKRRGEVAGRQLTVIDAPDLLHITGCLKEICHEIRRCILLSSPGPHAFLLVLQARRFTDEEKTVLQAMEDIFSETALAYTMVLFTHGDSLEEQSIEDYIETQGRELQQLVEKCGNRYHVLNNKNRSDRTQVTQLLDKIDNMVKGNRGSFLYQEAEERLTRREQRYEEQCRKEEELKLKYEEEHLRKVEELKQKYEEEKHQKEKELKQKYEEEQREKVEELKQKYKEEQSQKVQELKQKHEEEQSRKAEKLKKEYEEGLLRKEEELNQKYKEQERKAEEMKQKLEEERLGKAEEVKQRYEAQRVKAEQRKQQYEEEQRRNAQEIKHKYETQCTNIQKQIQKYAEEQIRKVEELKKTFGEKLWSKAEELKQKYEEEERREIEELKQKYREREGRPLQKHEEEHSEEIKEIKHRYNNKLHRAIEKQKKEYEEIEHREVETLKQKHQEELLRKEQELKQQYEEEYSEKEQQLKQRYEEQCRGVEEMKQRFEEEQQRKLEEVIQNYEKQRQGVEEMKQRYKEEQQREVEELKHKHEEELSMRGEEMNQKYVEEQCRITEELKQKHKEELSRREEEMKQKYEEEHRRREEEMMEKLRKQMKEEELEKEPEESKLPVRRRQSFDINPPNMSGGEGEAPTADNRAVLLGAVAGALLGAAAGALRGPLGAAAGAAIGSVAGARVGSVIGGAARAGVAESSDTHTQRSRELEWRRIMAAEQEAEETVSQELHSASELRIVLLGRSWAGKSVAGNTILDREEGRSDLMKELSGGEGEAPLADTQAPPSPPELRMVLLGKTGAGKSAVGNTILGREEFRSEASSSAVTRECEKRKGQVAGRRVAVIDTPELSQDKLQIRSCVSLSAPGPHAFLLVVPVGRFTEEERRAVETVQEIFSEEAIDNMVKGNNGSYYTSEMYQQAEAKIRQRQEEILKEKEETILKEEKELRAKHLKELENMERKMRLEIQKRDEKIRELEERIGELEEELRKEQGENHRIKLEEELRRKREERERAEREKEEWRGIMAAEQEAEETVSQELHRASELRIVLLGGSLYCGAGRTEAGNTILGRDEEEMIDTVCEFIEEEYCKSFDKVQELFGERAERNTMILFTHGQYLEGRTIEEHIEEAGRGIMAAEQEAEETVSQELHSASEMRIVLLGISWAGKSASGNTILGREEGRSGFSFSAVTRECVKRTGEVSGRRVTVVDTPDLLDTARVEIERCVSLSAPGPHAFLLLIPVHKKKKKKTQWRQSVVEEYCKALDKLQQLFGERAVRNTMILFTCGDDLEGRTIEQHIEEAGKELQQLVEKCGNRYHVLNNLDRSDRTQVTQLLDKIDNMVKGSGGCFLPNEIYQEVEERIRLKEQELNEKHKEELRRREEERKQKYEEEKRREEELKQKYEEEQRRREEEMKQKYEEEQRRREEMKQKYEEEQRRREEMKQKYEEEQRRRKEMKQKYEEEQRRREEMKQKYEEEQRRREEEMKQKYEEEQRRREEELMEKLRKQMKEEELEKEAEESKLPVRRRDSIDGHRPNLSGGEGEAPLADTQAPPSPPELRMVLLGKTGAGKSAAGNTILGREEFRSEASSSAVTRECEKRKGQVAGRCVAVINTPELSQDKLQIRSCVSLSAPGPHAFLLVIPVGRFTEEERRAVETVQETFSEEAVRRYMMLLFTHSDKLKGKTIEDYIQTGSKELQQLVEKCGNRYHVLNTEDRSDRTQVTQLLDKIDNMVKENNGSYYTSEMYQQAEAKIRQRQEEILKEKEETILREEEELRAKHLKELENTKRKMRLEIQKRDEKIRELEERIGELEEELRKEQGENHRIKLEEELRRKREERERAEREKEEYMEKGERERGEYEEKHRREIEAVRQRYQEIIRPEAERVNEFISRYEKPAEARGERAALGAVVSAVAGALREGAEVGAVLHTVSRAIREETALGAVMHAAKEAVREGAAQRAVISAVAVALREGAAIGTVLHTVAEAIEAAPPEPSQEQCGTKELKTVQIKLHLDSSAIVFTREQKKGEMAAAGSDPGRGIMAAEQEAEETVSQELHSPSDLRIVLIGRRLTGKSTAGNIILNREEGRSGFITSEVTEECENRTGEVSGRRVTVVDTPNLLDTDRVEIERCVSLSAPGPHAFLLVMKVFTKKCIDTHRESIVEQYCEAFDKVQELFGERAVRNTMILFTCGDDLRGRTIEQHIEEAGEELQQRVEKCGNRCHVLNNEDRSDRTQVTQLLDKIDNMVKGSGGCYLPNEIYQEVEERIRLKEQELNEKHKEERSSKEKEMKQKYEEEQRRREEMKQKYKEEQRRREEEMKQKYEEEQRKREEEMKQKYEEEQRKREEELEKEPEESKLPVRRRNSNEGLPPTRRGIMAVEQEAEETVSQELHSTSELRIVLLGGGKTGKSSSGNTILDRKEFRSGFLASARTKKGTGEVSGRRVTVVDTPEIFKTDRDEIERCVSLSAPGPHAFLQVIPVKKKKTQWRQSVVKHLGGGLNKVQELFGERAVRNTMILFTFGDRLKGRTIEQYIEEAGEEFQQRVEKCGNRYHVLNNKNRSDGTQVTQLLGKIENTVKGSGGCYLPISSEIYQQVEERIRLKEQELNEKHKEELRRREEEMKQKYKEEQRRREEEMKQKYEEEQRRREEEMKHKFEEEQERRENNSGGKKMTALTTEEERTDVERHIESESHQRKVKAVEQSQQITKFTVNTAPKVDNMTQLEAKLSDFDVEDVVVDIGYWFKASTKRKCRLDDHKLNVGWTTRTTLNRLHEAGEISQYQVDNFHKAVRAFFVAAVDYAFKKLPFKEPVLEHSQFIDFQQKMDCDVNDALYFVYRFSHLLPYGDPKEQDKLSEEFLDYQLMEEKDIPRSIWEQAVSRVSEQEVYHRMDKVWAHMATIKSPVTGMPKLPMLSKVAQLILTLPHSNADAERVFSMIGLNKTDTRNALALEGTLSSIMTIKMSGMEPNCFKYEPPAEVIKASKSAASSYNRRGIMAAEQEAEETVSQELHSPSELRIVLLGRSWTGKSAAGNTILDREEFRSEDPFTEECEKRTGEVSGRRVTVVDTPHLLHTDRVEIERCVSLSASGPHAFLLVIPVYKKEMIDTDRESLVEQDCESFDKVQQLFGERAVRNTMILFTRGDYLRGRTIEQHIEEAGEELQQLVEKCGNRYHVLNNKNRSDRIQVTQLLDKIDNMVKGSGGCFLSNEIYQEVEERIRKKEQELNEKHKEEQRRREEEMKQKYEEEQRRREEEMKQKYEEDQRRREEEMKQKNEEEQKRREEELMEKLRKQMKEEELEKEPEESKLPVRRRNSIEALYPTMSESKVEKESGESKLPVRRRNSKETISPNMSGGEGEAPLADTQAPPSPPELRMVLLGKTGAGKSAAGNTILGREEFRSEASSSAVTRECEKRKGQVAGRCVAVIDTPELSQDKLQIKSCVSLSAPGPHAFLLVIPVGRFTEEERRAVETVQEMFSEDAVRRYMMLLFTHGDKLKGKTIEDYIQTGSKELQQLVEKCGNRYHVLNILDRSDRTQVTQLLDKIDNMVKGNNGSYYTSEKGELKREGGKERAGGELKRARKEEEEETKNDF